MRHIVNYSGGACSFWAAARVIAKYGGENTVLLFADVVMEDDDLYRFNREISAYLGIAITVISDGRTPWEVFEEEGMLGNTHADLCSRILKRELLDRWHVENCDPKDTVIHLGLNWIENHRLVRFRARKPEWQIEAPMTEPPIWDKDRMIKALSTIGIQPPRLYGLGFPHNNCGGFCIKAGHAHFAHLYRVLPDRYLYHENKEQEIRKKLGNVSILRDRSGGKTRPLTLRDLRHRIDSQLQFETEDWGGCGCAVE